MSENMAYKDFTLLVDGKRAFPESPGWCDPDKCSFSKWASEGDAKGICKAQIRAKRKRAKNTVNRKSRRLHA